MSSSPMRLLFRAALLIAGLACPHSFLPGHSGPGFAGEPAAPSDHWSFQHPLRRAAPHVENAVWAKNPIDAFVLSQLESAGIPPAAEASGPMLVRRVYLDLVGLPPTAEQIQAFLADPAGDAYERLVERLLASPHFGERWGRHWLDLARYADSNGFDNDEPRPEAWRWRDWLIGALNRDLPFDEFTMLQLAGDLLPDAAFPGQLATGFHRNTPNNTEGGVDREEFRVRTVADWVDTTGAVWLGLTVGCAQCHSHKYDPLSQREYFGLFAFFNNVDEAQAEIPGGGQAAVLARAATPRETRIHRRGNFLDPGEPTSPGTPAILHSFTPRDPAQPDRLDLAHWLFDPANPLTARVAANRIWQHLFGRGLVATVDDFGTQGERPSHPELLDWLANDLIDGGWSQKRLIRRIVSSATYRQTSARVDLNDRDPENRLLARQSRFRVEGEILRDLALASAGLLSPRIGGPSYAAIEADQNAGSLQQQRRGMYLFVQRALPDPILSTFDLPDSHVACTRRDQSNTPLQALVTLNDPFFFRCARGLGLRIVRDRPTADVGERIDHAMRVCLARPPDETELARLRLLYDDQLAICRQLPDSATTLVGNESLPEAAAWIGVARVLLNLDEFMTRQ